jgi:predicted MFS family arabinose efflux permease
MFVMLTIVLLLSLVLLRDKIGSSTFKPKFAELFSKSSHVNQLSAARFFLFASRDIWFVVALPVFLQSQLQWGYAQVGTLMALWVMVYGAIQAIAPRITGNDPNGKTAAFWSALLSPLPAIIAALMLFDIATGAVLIVGLLVFGAIFAINSSVHSYLIVAWAREDGVSLDVGFYYMANAGGRLVGTILSGLVYQGFGLAACLVISSLLIAIASILSRRLAYETPAQSTP